MWLKFPTTEKELAARKFIRFNRNKKIATGRILLISIRYTVGDPSRPDCDGGSMNGFFLNFLKIGCKGGPVLRLFAA
jgi:hypothetical protein